MKLHKLKQTNQSIFMSTRSKERSVCYYGKVSVPNETLHSGCLLKEAMRKQMLKGWISTNVEHNLHNIMNGKNVRRWYGINAFSTFSKYEPNINWERKRYITSFSKIHLIHSQNPNEHKIKEDSKTTREERYDEKIKNTTTTTTNNNSNGDISSNTLHMNHSILSKKQNRVIQIFKTSEKIIKTAYTYLKIGCTTIKMIILHPSLAKEYYQKGVKNIKHTIDWVKTGILLFLTNMKISKNLIIKRLKGYSLSYSEYKLLIRTINDMFKLIPFSFFIIVPFAEFLLPVVLKVYPNLLPSTFKSHDNFNSIKKNLYAKQQLAKFLQQLIEEKEKQIRETVDIDSEKKKEILNKFHQQLINKDEKDINPFLSVEDTLKIAKLFKEDFVLEQMSLKSLQAICYLLDVKPYGMHYHVVLQLRHHFLRLQREDRELIYEGVDNLKKHTLIEICKDRGMNFQISEKEMKLQIQQWLQLASIKEVPYILLLYIRCVIVTHSIMDIHNNTNKKTESVEHSSHQLKEEEIDEKQKLIREAKEKLVDLQMKEQQIKESIKKETEEGTRHQMEDAKEEFNTNDKKVKIDFLKQNKYMQNELNMLKQICDLQHKELKNAFSSLTELAEKKQTCDINEIIKTMSQKLSDIEKHINELNAHKQIEMDEYFYPEEDKEIMDLKN